MKHVLDENGVKIPEEEAAVLVVCPAPSKALAVYAAVFAAKGIVQYASWPVSRYIFYAAKNPPGGRPAMRSFVKTL